MPAWKKVITSGSDAELNSLNITTTLTATGSLDVSGSSTLLGNSTITGDVTVYGNQTISGSTSFGDSLDDTHTFTGSLLVNGGITGSIDYSNLDNTPAGLVSASSQLDLTEDKIFFGSNSNKAVEIDTYQEYLDNVGDFNMSASFLTTEYSGARLNQKVESDYQVAFKTLNIGEWLIVPKDSYFTGWAQYSDTIYTSGSAYFVTASTNTVLYNNANTIIDSQKPIDIDEFYFSGGFELSAISSSFNQNETVIGWTSGASGKIRRITSSSLYLTETTGSFSISEFVSGSTSNATGSISSLIEPHIAGRLGDSIGVMLSFNAEPSHNDQWLDVWIDISGSIGEIYKETFTFPKGAGIERSVIYTLPTAYTLDTWVANGGVIYVESSHDCDIYDIKYNFNRYHIGR